MRGVGEVARGETGGEVGKEMTLTGGVGVSVGERGEWTAGLGSPGGLVWWARFGPVGLFSFFFVLFLFLFFFCFELSYLNLILF